MCIRYTGCVQNMILQLLFIVEILENIKDRKCYLDCNMGCPWMTITIFFKVPSLSQVTTFLNKIMSRVFNKSGQVNHEPFLYPLITLSFSAINWIWNSMWFNDRLFIWLYYWNNIWCIKKILQLQYIAMYCNLRTYLPYCNCKIFYASSHIW